MARRTINSWLSLAIRSSWPVSVAIAIAILAIAFVIFPLFARQSPLLMIVSQGLEPFAFVGAGLFGLISLAKGIVTFQRTSQIPEDQCNAKNISLGGFEPAHKFNESRRKPIKEWSLELIQSIEWKRFEDVCQKFYEAKSIRCESTPLGPDGGVDIRIFPDDSRPATAIVQCKAWGDSYVGVKPIRELLGVMVHEKIAKALFMTSGQFSDEAKAFAVPNQITLIDGRIFLAMIRRLPVETAQELLEFATAGDFNIPTCPACGRKMRFITGKEGKRDFWGCPAFPKCRKKLWARRGSSNLPTTVYQWLCSRKLWSSSSDEPEAADTGCSGADAPSH